MSTGCQSDSIRMSVAIILPRYTLSSKCDHFWLQKTRMVQAAVPNSSGWRHGRFTLLAIQANIMVMVVGLTMTQHITCVFLHCESSETQRRTSLLPPTVPKQGHNILHISAAIMRWWHNCAVGKGRWGSGIKFQHIHPLDLIPSSAQLSGRMFHPLYMP